MPDTFKYSAERKSFQTFNEPYFWTSVIKDWKHLLTNDDAKMITISSFQWLIQHRLAYIYGYVITPNHIHVLWEQLKMNGKEIPKASFEKYTGHMFLKQVRIDKESLSDYASKKEDRNYLFWQRDPLAILIRNRKMAAEKLDYIHYNPLNHIGNYVIIRLVTDFHQQNFMRRERMNLNSLLIIWITCDLKNGRWDACHEMANCRQEHIGDEIIKQFISLANQYKPEEKTEKAPLSESYKYLHDHVVGFNEMGLKT